MRLISDLKRNIISISRSRGIENIIDDKCNIERAFPLSADLMRIMTDIVESLIGIALKRIFLIWSWI